MLSTRVTIIAVLAAAWCLTSEAGLLYDVACPGVNSELQCPAGQMIKVIEMSSGEESDADCADRKKAARVSNGKAFHQAMIGWVKLICNNLESCRLPKPNMKMFVEKNSHDNFVQIAYECGMKPAGVQTVVACENQIAELKCESGEIEIVTAKFGRFDKNTCTKKPLTLTFSASYTAGGIVKGLCNGREDCSVTASSKVLGPAVPLRNIPMYLIVDYICA